MKKITKHIAHWAIGFLLLGFLFYWFQYRPTQIRQDCQQIAYDRGVDYFDYAFLQNETVLRKSLLQEEYMTRTYARCIHEKGLK